MEIYYMMKVALQMKGAKMDVQMNGIETTGVAMQEKISLGPYLTLYTRINSKWIRDLKVKNKIIHAIEKKMYIYL